MGLEQTFNCDDNMGKFTGEYRCLGMIITMIKSLTKALFFVESRVHLQLQ